jgi:hypothetical protein
MRTILALLLSTTLASAINHSDTVTVCKVFDPTTTPLNVRTLPGNCRTATGHDCSTNGKILGTLDNGTEVEIEKDTLTSVQGKPWVFVMKTTVGDADVYGLTGWVFRPYLTACHFEGRQ